MKNIYKYKSSIINRLSGENFKYSHRSIMFIYKYMVEFTFFRNLPVFLPRQMFPILIL